MQLMFVHGSGGTPRAWKYQSSHYPDSIAIALPGHPEGDFIDSIPGMVAWLNASVEEKGISELVLVGHSMGGGIALQYALDYPEDVRALVLVGSGGRLRVHPDTIDSMAQADANSSPFTRMIDGMLCKISEDFAPQLRTDALELGPAAFLNDFRACDQFDVMDRLGEIDIPALAIVGTEDVMTPVKYAEFLVEKMPNAELEIIEGGTHYVFAEYPDQVNGAIDRFLNTLK